MLANNPTIKYLDVWQNIFRNEFVQLECRSSFIFLNCYYCAHFQTQSVRACSPEWVVLKMIGETS